MRRMGPCELNPLGQLLRQSGLEHTQHLRHLRHAGEAPSSWCAGCAILPARKVSSGCTRSIGTSASTRDELGARVIDIHASVAKDGEPLAPVWSREC
jgi:hypothetical protein